MTTRDNKSPKNVNKQTPSKKKKPTEKEALSAMATKLKIDFTSRHTIKNLRKMVSDEKLRIKNADSNADERNLELEEKYKAFIHWFAMPDPVKCELLEIQPKNKKYPQPTLKLFAKYHGIHFNTLTNWKNRREFMSLVDAHSESWGSDMTPNVLAALFNRCMRLGRGDDVELWLAYFKGWSRKQIHEHKPERFDMDDIRAVLAPLPKEKQDKFYATLINIIGEAEISRRGEEDTDGSIAKS